MNYCWFIKAFTSKPSTGTRVSVYSSWLWWWCASHRPGIPIAEHFGLFARCTESCVFLRAAAKRSGLHRRRAGWKREIPVLWQAEMTHIQKEPCLFCMEKWGRGWRVATETLGSGQTSPHFSTYSMLGFCIALHSLHRWSAVFYLFFCKVHGGKCSFFEDTPPPDIHCCHDGQRSPLDRGSAGWRRGRLIWDGGSHLRMLFCLRSL